MLNPHQATMSVSSHQHVWVRVTSPLDRRVYLQVCNNYGVVRSSNTQVKTCHAKPLRFLKSNSVAVAKIA